MQKTISFKIKGMQRDLSASSFNSEYAYENMNLRIMPTNEGTLLSIINERGNKELTLKGITLIVGTPIGQAVIDNELVLFTTATDTDTPPERKEDDESIIQFPPDYIYKWSFTENEAVGTLLYNGYLRFSSLYPIETLAVYENENVKKIYWTDGFNQPRVINIVTNSSIRNKWEDTSFDFVRKIKLNESIRIVKEISSGGLFSSGTIQYAFTYFNKFGQESNIFYTSPLYYISYNERGGSPEDVISNSFDISISNADTSFDYIRIYSIQRTSINAKPIVKRLVDLSLYDITKSELNIVQRFIERMVEASTINVYKSGESKPYKTLDNIAAFSDSNNVKTWVLNTNTYNKVQFVTIYGKLITLMFYTDTSINIEIDSNNNTTTIQTLNGEDFTEIIETTNVTNFIDNGTTGDIIDPTELLYKGGEEIVAGTLSHKDNTLFLGNIKKKNLVLSDEIKTFFKGKKPVFTYKYISPPSPKGYYTYKNQLDDNSYNFKTFKYLEHYRFGIQAQYKTGKWSEPIWLNDVQNTIPISTQFSDDSNIGLPIAKYELTDTGIINKFVEEGYISIRPVVVYPDLNDRECICQGILCPTVYNVEDRKSNSPFAQSSWFARPNIPFDIDNSLGLDLYRLTLYTTINVSDLDKTYIINGIRYNVYNYITDESNPDTVTHIIITSDKHNRKDLEPPSSESSSEYVIANSTTTDKQNVLYTLALPLTTEANYTDLWGNTSAPFVSKYSRAGIIQQDDSFISIEGRGSALIDVINNGNWAEFRNNKPIPSNTERNSEIQCIYNPPTSPYIKTDYTEEEKNKWIINNKEYYFVDQNIVTLHSPDIEFDETIQNLDTTNLKLRIVGMVPLTSFISDIDIQAGSPNNFKDTTDFPIGFYKETIGAETKFRKNDDGTENRNTGSSHFGYRSMLSGVFWMDDASGYKSGENNGKRPTGFAVYPWHRNGSLNNTKYATDGHRSAMLEKKKMSNLRVSYKTQYLKPNLIWNAFINGSNTRTGISGVSIFNSNEISLVKIPAPTNSKLQDINYYGNVDKVLTIDSEKSNNGYKGTYPIVVTSIRVWQTEDSLYKLFHGDYYPINESTLKDRVEIIDGNDPVRIKYKSTPHAVMALNYTTDSKQRVLPTIKDSNGAGYSWTVNQAEGHSINYNPFWTTDLGVYQDAIETDITYPNTNPESQGILCGWLWLGELYRDDVSNRFGGTTDDAFENNKWIPCGDPVSLKLINGTVRNNIILYWRDGDTYYQRYDHIKTYPFTNEDQNSVTEIISFMCETRVNLDGRYDKNRGQNSNLTMTPVNFNKMNDVYSQKDNFFTYRITNSKILNPNTFPNIITWTKTKSSGELVDSWTNVTLASVLEMDGDKGSVRALKRFNNNIFAFQDTGISQILYNENVQLSSTQGVPIEIANSGKVNGKRYLTTNIGCSNKWSICETSNGLYFIDDITKGIFLFNGKLDNLSDRLGFHSWINSTSKGVNIWNPLEFNGFVTYYDKVNGDVFFISKDNCLAFSEPLGQFTSFYSYDGVPYFTNVGDLGIAIREAKGISDNKYKFWLHNGGTYNRFFNKFCPFYTTVIANPESQVDKIFNTLEFRADCWTDNEIQGNVLLNNTFDTLTVWNEYQHGSLKLSNVPNKPSSLKRKFRIWRANIPRDSLNNRDRMRNPWLYIKLSMENENNYKTLLHDMMVHYFIQ